MRRKSPGSVRRLTIHAGHGCELLEDRRLLTATSDTLPQRTFATAPLDLSDPTVSVGGFQFGRGLSTTDVFNLQSKPDSNFTIYLDFDGHVTEGTSWNSSYGITTIVSPPFDLDGDPTSYSLAELERITISWQRTAEDFAPFDINVTTRDPGLDALIRSGGNDTRWGARAVATFDTFANCGCGGHAFIDSFNDPVDTPTFIYNLGEGSLGETFSHEVGHMLNLFHDGTNNGGLEYYPGHGSGATQWGSIMGAPFDENVTTWNDGDYFDADNFQDDLSDITTLNGFTYRSDDYGSTLATASAINVSQGNQIHAFGIIERNTDRDYFLFQTGSGAISVDIQPLGTRPNLDVWAGIYNSLGNLVAESNPGATLDASFTNLVLAAGTYYLRVEGVGSHDVYNPTTNNVDAPAVKPWQNANPVGYSDYGSLGQYKISGTVVPLPGNSFSIAATDAVRLEGESGQQVLTFTVTRSGDTSVPAQVDFVVTATLPDFVGDNYPSLANVADFVAGSTFSGTLPFAAGQAALPLTFTVQADTTFEQDEYFDVVLSNPSATWRLADSRATGTILSDENVVGIPAISSTVSVNEGPFDGALIRWRQVGAASGAFDEWALDNISLSNSTFGDDFDPDIDLANWSELSTGEVNNRFGGSGNSYFVTGIPDRRLVARLLHAQPGDVLQFDIIFGDGTNGGENADPGEDVFLEFSLDYGSTWTEFGVLDTEDYTSWTTVQFPLPVGIDTNPPAELRFVVTRDGGLTNPATVTWEVQTGTGFSADAADFMGGTLPSGQVFFAPGARTAEIAVSINGDSDLEPNESFTLLLTGSTSSSVTIDANLAAATGTIINDDASFAINPGPQFRWRQLASSGGAFDNWAIDNVQLSNGSFADDFDPDIDLQLWDTVNGGSVNTNFGGSGNSLFFAGGGPRSISSNRLAVSPGDVLSFDLIYGNDVNGGENPEPGEEVVLEYSVDGGISWSLLATYPLSLTSWTTIDVPVPANAIPDPPVMMEGDTGTTTFSFVVQRMGGGPGGTTVAWEVVGSGVNPANAADFVGGVLPSGSLAFLPGEQFKTIQVEVVGDTVLEPDETFDLQLGATSIAATITAIILNDDSSLPGDFNGDGNLDCADIDALTHNIAGQTGDLLYDLSADGSLSLADVDLWLAYAGAANLPSGNAYLYGDANLDGFVDGQDFIIWNSNKFNAVMGWCSGDFNADGISDGQDFIIWNTNKFTSALILSRPAPQPPGSGRAEPLSTTVLRQSQETLATKRHGTSDPLPGYARRVDTVFATWRWHYDPRCREGNTPSRLLPSSKTMDSI